MDGRAGGQQTRAANKLTLWLMMMVLVFDRYLCVRPAMLSGEKVGVCCNFLL